MHLHDGGEALSVVGLLLQELHDVQLPLRQRGWSSGQGQGVEGWVR